jgi:hypothetical protein
MAISLSITTGLDGFRPSDITVGAAAPAVGDIEFRYNPTDGGANPITRKELVIALEAFTRAILSDAIFVTPTGL